MDSNLDLVSVKIQNGWGKMYYIFEFFSKCYTFHNYNIFYSYCIPLIDAHIVLNFWLIQMRIIFPFSNCNGQKRTEGILHVLNDLKDDTMYLTADSKRSP